MYRLTKLDHLPLNKNRKKLLCTFAIIGIILPLHSPYSHAQEIINSKEEILFITSYNSDSKHTYDNINSCITTYQKLGGTCPAVVENMNAISLEHAWRWPKIVKNIIDKHPKVSLIILLGGEAWSGYFSLEEEEYKKITKQITQFIQGDTKEIIDDLQNKMMQASESLNFELAKEYRDLIQHINHVTSKQHVQFADQIDRDIFGYYQDKGYLSLQLFFMRNGKLLARDLNLVPLQDVHEQITQFIVGFYQENTYPKEILLPEDIDTTLLEEIVECKIIKPQKGQKAKLVEMATNNAKEALEKKFLLIEKNQKATVGAIKQLGEKLNMITPRRIELFDNSNIQGAYAVAGMVCFVDGVPSKKDYRKFKIKTVEGPDDYGSMKEVIYRRYYRVLVEGLKKPDLIIVDGGKGQIKVAKEVIDSLNIGIKVCGLAKDDHHSTAVLIDSDFNEISIDKKSELFFLLTRMQDEVHRYAISFHKNVRSKSLFQSILDDVEGIGPKRKKELLKHFGSVKKLKEATLEQLEEVLPKEVAKNLFTVLQNTK